MKGLRKVLLLVMVLVIALSAFGVAGAAESKVKVALVLSGFLGDKSFNDSAYEGLERSIKEFGIDLKVLESKVPSDWESNLVAMAAEGYDLVLGCSTQLQEIIAKHAPDFPDVKFGIIDGVVKAPNVMSAIFAQNEGSFLAGAAAATMRSASMSRPESVSSMMAIFGSSMAICRISARFFSPPEKPSFR